jgi:phage-related protein
MREGIGGLWHYPAPHDRSERTLTESLGVDRGAYQIWYTTDMRDVGSGKPILSVAFYRTAAGNEPVRDCLHSLSRADRRSVGEDVKTAQFGWPLGMPLIRKLEPGLWEVRSGIIEGTARVLFTVDDGTMILLHGFVKRSRKTPLADLRTARSRLAQLRER